MPSKKHDAATDPTISKFLQTQTGLDAAINPKPPEKAEKSPLQRKKEVVVEKRKQFMAELAQRNKAATPPVETTPPTNTQAAAAESQSNSPQAQKYYGTSGQFFQKKSVEPDTAKADDTLKSLQDRMAAKKSPSPNSK
jgi:hypothetical protein